LNDEETVNKLEHFFDKKRAKKERRKRIFLADEDRSIFDRWKFEILALLFCSDYNWHTRNFVNFQILGY